MRKTNVGGDTKRVVRKRATALKVVTHRSLNGKISILKRPAADIRLHIVRGEHLLNNSAAPTSGFSAMLIAAQQLRENHPCNLIIVLLSIPLGIMPKQSTLLCSWMELTLNSTRSMLFQHNLQVTSPFNWNPHPATMAQKALRSIHKDPKVMNTILRSRVTWLPSTINLKRLKWWFVAKKLSLSWELHQLQHLSISSESGLYPSWYSRQHRGANRCKPCKIFLGRCKLGLPQKETSTGWTRNRGHVISTQI